MFSVVIPLYNKEPHVARALQSVLDQTFSSWEAIIVDDGSTDGSAAVVRSFSDPRIKYILQENQGPSEARNRGIGEARYPYIAFLDADDEWFPGHLATLNRLVEAFPQAAIYAQAYVIRKGDQELRPRYHRVPRRPLDLVIPDYFAAAKPGVLPVWTSATAIPRRVLDKIGGFPRNIPRGQDLECWSLAALEGPVAFSNEVGAVYYKDTVNRHDRRRRTLDRKLGIEVALEEGRVPIGLANGAKLYIQRLYVRRYEALLKAGARAEARQMRRKIGKPLAWDTAWRLTLLGLRAAVPYGLITLYRKARHS